MSIQTEKCPHCGTTWVFDTSGGRRQGGMSGFIMASINTHWYWCNQWTPEQRWAFINRTEKRLAKKPNLHAKVYFDKSHGGLKTNMPIIHCKQCNTQINWDDQKRQYARLIAKGFTEQEAKEKLPLCHKCVTRTPKPPKVKKSQL